MYVFYHDPYCIHNINKIVNGCVRQLISKIFVAKSCLTNYRRLDAMFHRPSYKTNL